MRQIRLFRFIPLLIVPLLPFIPLVSSPAAGPILVLKVEGVINPVMGNYVKEGIETAKKTKASAVLIELNTPGGLLDATRTIISAMINTDIPVLVYVAPRGARATSAGVFIAMASDVAAMAPQTHIGAAHPVTIGGEGPTPPLREKKEEEPKKEKGKTSEKENQAEPKSVMEEKMVSDAAAYIRTLAKERGRNADWAERAVRESLSLTAEEAKAQNVIEIVASSRSELMQAVHGKELKKNQKTLTLNVKDALFNELELTPVQKFLHLLAHPNVAYILLMIGVYALIYEFASPGIGLGGIVGAICLVLAFFSLQVLPISTVGLILVVLGLLAMLMDLFVPSHGVLTFGGLVAFAIGSFMLIDVPKELHVPRVSLMLILPTVLTTAFFFGFVVRKIFVARRAKPHGGVESLIGKVGEARSPLAPSGFVFLDGELWTAETEQAVNQGDKVQVLGTKGNILVVKKVMD